jgi:hypothetical protein
MHLDLFLNLDDRLVCWMVVALQVLHYWGPPFFGHDETDYSLVVVELSDYWGLCYLIQYIRGHRVTSDCYLHQCVSLFIFASINVLERKPQNCLSLEQNSDEQPIYICLSLEQNSDEQPIYIWL